MWTKTVIACGNNLAFWPFETNVAVSIDGLAFVLREPLIVLVRKQFSDNIFGHGHKAKYLDQHDGHKDKKAQRCQDKKEHDVKKHSLAIKSFIINLQVLLIILHLNDKTKC